MSRALVLVILAMVAQATVASQALVVLRIRAVLTDTAGLATPIARYALLVSNEPATREPRRILTRADGTADVRLSPGKYIVESDEPLAYQGKAYRWRQTLDIPAGRDTTLDLTVTNAVIEPIDAGTGADAAPSATSTALLLQQWYDSVVELWTPTAHASGFLVDAAGLIATSQRVIGDATSVEVQITRSIKVAGTVVEADRERDLAIVRIAPSIVASIAPVPLGCPRAGTALVAAGQDIFSIAAPLRQTKSWMPATVERVDATVIASDLTLATGGIGGPVFTASGEIVGLSSVPDERDAPRRGATRVARIEGTCELVAAAVEKAAASPAPSATLLPVEPTTPAPIATFKEAVTRRAGSLKPYQMAAAEFDVSFITPILNYAAQSQPNQTFSNWSEYVADIPPVLFVRVTPRMAEGFWAKMARGAAYTQGMALPAIKRLGPGFLRLQALCGRTEVTPIHPFKLEQRISETDAVYEGLYAFDPSALGPECGTVTLVLYSEKEPTKADSRPIDPRILQQISQDFAVGRTQ